jgi:choline kinase
MKAVILSAGQGRRLFPLTARLPKCLLPVNGRSVIEWQVDALRSAGIDRVVVVVGFGATKVRTLLARRCPPLPEIHTIFNPRFDVADNLISCWTARGEMDEDFLLINGDTLFEPSVLERLLQSELAPVTVAVARKPAYDADDMKVHCDGQLLRRIGKDLPARETDGESIGVILFRGSGPSQFRHAIENAARRSDAGRLWYLSAVNEMAAGHLVQVASVNGSGWAEIDYPKDLVIAEELVAGWSGAEEKVALQSTA